LVENVVIPIDLEGVTGIVNLHWEPFSQVCSIDSDRHRKLRDLALTNNDSQAIRLRLVNLGQEKMTTGIEFIERKRRILRSQINAQG
jgi:hypothetical protein